MPLSYKRQKCIKTISMPRRKTGKYHEILVAAEGQVQGWQTTILPPRWGHSPASPQQPDVVPNNLGKPPRPVLQRTDGYRARFLPEVFNLSAGCGANIFATSRHIPEITDRFSASTMLEIRASDEDVRQYLNGRISQSGLRLLDTCCEKIKNEIAKAVDGMFLLAQLHSEFVVSPNGPRGYDHAYDEAMKRITGYDADLENLATQALAVEDGDLELDKEDVSRVDDMISIYAGLVTVNEESSIIRLVYYMA
ncbi:hypothetical protein EDB81DRAFT_769046 [Dactylonectria macrodidyma]|uniref:Uncharacterized protein n=1 Tax=Dactylonectria macrodidyma TaxID=307937 RepID=A0A9P9CZS6_9HYPO|nr:hypothetical protein EDB81DRAFT_769046 [Dactylonectria macrodidyma]